MIRTPGAERETQIRELRSSAGRLLGHYGDTLGYRAEQTFNTQGQKRGIELLVVHAIFQVEAILGYIRNEGETLALFQKGLLEAFCRILTGKEGIVSFNAYIADIGDIRFREVVTMIMMRFKKGDRMKVKIEVLEAPFGEINGKFIANIIWLKQQGFIVDIDDYNLLGVTNDMSQALLETIGEYVDGIKIDWKTTQALLRDPALRNTLIGLRKRSQKLLTLEGIQGKVQIGELIDTGADYYQISGFSDL